MQRVALEPRDQEVAIVHQDVTQSRRCEIGGKIGLPDSLGEPQSHRRDAQPALDRFPHPRELLLTIEARERRKHGLVEAGRQDLDLSIHRQPADLVEIGGLVFLEPLEQRSRNVQHDREEFALPDALDERTIHVPHMLFEDVVEIAHRLMEVDTEDKTDRIQLVALRKAQALRDGR